MFFLSSNVVQFPDMKIDFENYKPTISTMKKFV